jgi:hypothetical protein
MGAKLIIFLTVFILSFAFVQGCKKSDDAVSPAEENITLDTAKVKYAGVRSSAYGITPFPDAAGWEKAMAAMKEKFPGSTASAIWIVGTIYDDNTAHLEFPSGGGSYNNISFSDSDKHEAYLDYFDTRGIKVFLQAEPADAEMNELIDLVLSRYKHHPCVAGFGVDVEWYRVSKYPGWGMKITDSLAKAWEVKVKSYNSSYQLFLKHWDPAWMPPEYRGDIIFTNDSQGFSNAQAMVNEFKNDWSPRFYPNTVFFQIGYEADKDWWHYFNDPPKELGEWITKDIPQKCGVFWVDFTLKDVLQAE